jgi:hypothetical protein
MTARLPARSLLLPLLLVVLWQLWGLGLPERSPAPLPLEVVEAAGQLIGSGDLPMAVLLSLGRVALGFLLAGSLALLLGLLMGYIRTVERNLDPIVESFRPVAPIALLPLAILWFGTGNAGGRLRCRLRRVLPDDRQHHPRREGGRAAPGAGGPDARAVAPAHPAGGDLTGGGARDLRRRPALDGLRLDVDRRR